MGTTSKTAIKDILCFQCEKGIREKRCIHLFDQIQFSLFSFFCISHSVFLYQSVGSFLCFHRYPKTSTLTFCFVKIFQTGLNSIHKPFLLLRNTFLSYTIIPGGSNPFLKYLLISISLISLLRKCSHNSSSEITIFR